MPLTTENAVLGWEYNITHSTTNLNTRNTLVTVVNYILIVLCIKYKYPRENYAEHPTYISDAPEASAKAPVKIMK